MDILKGEKGKKGESNEHIIDVLLSQFLTIKKFLVWFLYSGDILMEKFLGMHCVII